MTGSTTMPFDPMFFAVPDAFRVWLDEHAATTQALWVGFYKKNSGTPSITWPEAVDEALCFGWIDGMRKGIDATRYAIRFTPRKSKSIWSAVNVSRVAELESLGRMRPKGLAAFAKRAEATTSIYAYEQPNVALEAADEQQFRANQPAWEFFQAQPASYRKAALWWVISAKQAATKHKRLATLIEDSAAGRTLAHLTRTPKPK